MMVMMKSQMLYFQMKKRIMKLNIFSHYWTYIRFANFDHRLCPNIYVIIERNERLPISTTDCVQIYVIIERNERFANLDHRYNVQIYVIIERN
jgi:hypothetical protein